MFAEICLVYCKNSSENGGMTRNQLNCENGSDFVPELQCFQILRILQKGSLKVVKHNYPIRRWNFSTETLDIGHLSNFGERTQLCSDKFGNMYL